MQFFMRRQYVVKKTMQYAAVIYVCVIVMAIMAFQTWLTYYTLSANLAKANVQLPLTQLLFYDVLITMAVMLVIVVAMTIFGSHKVAGPLYRCEKVLREMQKGDLTSVIHLRKGDLLVEFSEEMNLALANLREIAAEDQAHVQEALRLLALVRGGVDVPEVQKSLERAMLALTKVGSKIRFERDVSRATASFDMLAEKAPAGPAAGAAFVPGSTMLIAPPTNSQAMAAAQAAGIANVTQPIQRVGPRIGTATGPAPAPPQYAPPQYAPPQHMPHVPAAHAQPPMPMPPPPPIPHSAPYGGAPTIAHRPAFAVPEGYPPPQAYAPPPQAGYPPPPPPPPPAPRAEPRFGTITIPPGPTV